VNADDTLGEGEVFYDMTSVAGEIALDGLKVDQRGNVYVSGPGGIWLLSPQAKHIGTIQAPELPANFAWGDEDGTTLYMTDEPLSNPPEGARHPTVRRLRVSPTPRDGCR
jgi:gluconolactonase